MSRERTPNSTSYQATFQKLAEDICLLKVLNNAPRCLVERGPFPKDASNHQLSLKKEKSIGETLAFISARTDDPAKVMAVSIEENLDGQGITWRVASNTEDLDGSEVKNGLEIIAKTLEETTNRVNSTEEMRAKVFQQIVFFDSPRILLRLRSRHAPKSKHSRVKPAVITMLQKELGNQSIRPDAYLSWKDIRGIRQRVREIYSIFLQLERLSTDGDFNKLLRDIIFKCHNFDLKMLNLTLGLSPSLDPSLKKYFPKAILKLGRYYTSALDLVNAAKRSQHLFQQITLAVIDNKTFSRTLLDEDVSLEHIAFSRLQNAPDISLLTRNFKGLIRDSGYSRASKLSDVMKSPKIHAEIQLLSFYDTAINIKKPRYICSSKSACFLCNLFIKIHGIFLVPRSHGRLYTNWILPDPSKYHSSYLKAAEELVEQLEALLMLALAQERTIQLCPSESVVASRGAWTSQTTLTSQHMIAGSSSMPLESVPQLEEYEAMSSESGGSQDHDDWLYHSFGSGRNHFIKDKGLSLEVMCEDGQSPNFQYQWVDKSQEDDLNIDDSRVIKGQDVVDGYEVTIPNDAPLTQRTVVLQHGRWQLVFAFHFP